RTPPRPRSPLFPYTTLFRSGLEAPVPALDPRPILTMADMGHGGHAGHHMTGTGHGEPGHASMDHASMDHGAMDHAAMGHAGMDRSEEHTSELQSRENLVCRL